jgi:hypothetical protein
MLKYGRKIWEKWENKDEIWKYGQKTENMDEIWKIFKLKPS